MRARICDHCDKVIVDGDVCVSVSRDGPLTIADMPGPWDFCCWDHLAEWAPKQRGRDR